MKKIIYITLILLMLFQISVSAKYDIGSAANELILSGEALPYERVTVILFNSDNMGCSNAEDTIKKYESNLKSGTTMTTSEIVLFTNIIADSNGKWSYKVDMSGKDANGNDMDSETYKANYTLYTNKGDKDYIIYASIAFRKSILPTLKEKASASDNYKSLTDSLIDTIDFITDGSDFRKLADKTAVSKLIKDDVSAINADSDKAVEELTTIVNNAVVIASVCEGKIQDFDKVLSIVEYDKDDADNITDQGHIKVINALKDKSSYKNIDEYKKYANLQIKLNLFNNNKNKTGTNLVKVLSNIGEDIGLDLSGFNKLSESNKSYVARQLAVAECNTPEEMQKKLNSLVSAVSANNNQGGGSGGGSSSSGGGSKSGSSKDNSSYIANMGTGVSDEYIMEHKFIYSDLSEAAWAADGIVYLANEGIINGYSDGTFKPHNNITRAEFVKIISEAFFGGEQIEYSCEFPDVNENDWYGKYINIAYNKGIVAGDNFGRFNPNSPITRQDMAVIIYKAAKEFNLISEKTEGTAFSDDSEISDYAKEAVYCLKNNNIINGVGDNLFAPKNNANRVSAAWIIYSLMINSVK